MYRQLRAYKKSYNTVNRCTGFKQAFESFLNVA